jgi:hypothetical protein
LITGLCCSSDCNVIDLIEWKLWVSLKEAAHGPDHQIICASSGVERTGFSKWGANSIDKNNGCASSHDSNFRESEVGSRLLVGNTKRKWRAE